MLAGLETRLDLFKYGHAFDKKSQMCREYGQDSTRLEI